jgi:hypothetical protein
MPQFLTGPYYIKRGVTGRTYKVLLRDANKQPVDLSLADHVNLVLRLRGQTTPTLDKGATVLQVGDAQTGTDVGWVEYDWGPGDTNTSGVYDAEFALYDANGQVYARAPSDGYLEVVIQGNLSAAGP